MKIFYISQCSFPSTAAQSVYDMCVSEVFANRGYDTTLIIKNKFWERAPNGYRGNMWDFYGVKCNFKIRKIIGLPRFTSWFQHKAMKHVDKNDSLVFTQSVSTAVVALDCGHYVLLDRHGLMPVNQEEMLRERVELSRFLGISVVTKTLRKDYTEKISALANKIVAVPNGVRNSGYINAALAEEARESERKAMFVAGYVGSFHQGKGIEVILKLAQLCQSISFRIYGGTSDEIRFRFGIDQLPDNLDVRGRVPQSHVPQCMASFNVALLPNQKQVFVPAGTDIGNWTSPMKMFEYMASGRAIIASDLPVLREVLKDGHNALLVPPTDYDAWRDAIKLLRSDPGLRKQLGKQAQKDAREKYSWEARVERIFRELDIEGKLLK